MVVQLNSDRKGPKISPSTGSFTMTTLLSTRRSLSSRFLGQKLIIGMEHPPYSPDFSPSDFWLFLKIKFASKDKYYRTLKTSKRKLM
jgi:hypothetical protein